MSRPTGSPALSATSYVSADESYVLGVDSVAAHTTSIRFGQLTYSSFDLGDGVRGGYQVKQTSGEVTDDERRFLVAGVATGLDDGRRMPALPTEAELEARTRRLVYAPGPPAIGEDGRPRETAAYWHTTSAGQDSSGRPGNVFAHILLDRAPAAALPPLRPSDLLLAPQWLRPYGSQAVLDTALGEVPPPPWADVVLNRTEVVSFLVDEATWRPGLLAALLDAVYAAMAPTEGPPVVLAVSEPDRGARWIAAVAHLMSPGTSRRLFWSTLERASGLDRMLEKRIQLAVIAADELDMVVDSSGVVLIVDGKETVELGDLPHGQPHLTRPNRGEITVTPYSVVAAVVLQDTGLAETVLTQQDQIAAEAGDQGLPCGWPMALAVLEHADDLGDVQAEARRLVEDGLRMPLPGPLARRVRTLLAIPLGRTAADALEQIEAIGPNHSSYEVAVNTYYGRAIDDSGWLLEQEPFRNRPILPPEALDADLVDQACTALDSCVAGAEPTDDDRMAMATLALRLIGFALDIGLADLEDGITRSLPDAIARCLNSLVGEILLHPVRGPRLVVSAGPLPEAVQATYVRPWVDATLDTMRGRPGGRIQPDVLAWLFPVPPSPPRVDPPGMPEAAIPPTLVEIAAQVTSVVPDPSAFRMLAARVLLETAERDLPERLARLAKGPSFTAAELCALVAAHDPLPVVPLMLPSLLRVPGDDALGATVQRLLSSDLESYRGAHPAVADVLAAAELRRNALEWDTGRAVKPRALLGSAMSILIPGRSFAHDLVDAVIAARIVEAVDTSAEIPERASLVHWIIAEATPAGVVSNRVVGHLMRRATSEFLVDSAVAAQLGSADAGVVRAGPRAWTEPARLRVTAVDGTEPLLDHIVRRSLRGMQAADIVEFVRHVRVAVARFLRHGEPDPAQDAFAERWWRGIGAGDAAHAAFHQRGFFR